MTRLNYWFGNVIRRTYLLKICFTYDLRRLTFRFITQVLRSTTMFLVGTPSALWRLPVAGPTSPAWVRAPAPWPLRGKQRSERRWPTWSWRVERRKKKQHHVTRCLPLSLHQTTAVLLPRSLTSSSAAFSRTHSPLPWNLTLEDTARNEKQKMSASWWKKEKKRKHSLFEHFWQHYLVFFYTVLCPCHVSFCCLFSCCFNRRVEWD